MDTSDADAARAAAVAGDAVALVRPRALPEDDDEPVHVGRAAQAYALREGVDTAREFHGAFAAMRAARNGLPDAESDAGSSGGGGGGARGGNDDDNDAAAERAHAERDPADAGSGALPWTEDDAAHAAAVFAPRPAAFDEDSSDEEDAWRAAAAAVPVAVPADLSDEAMLNDDAELAAIAARHTAEEAGYHALPMDPPGDDDDMSPEALVAARQVTFIAGGAGRAPTVVVDRAVVAMADHEVTHIQSVMASFKLPDHAVPAWARSLRESDWMPTLAYSDERQQAAPAPAPSSSSSTEAEER